MSMSKSKTKTSGTQSGTSTTTADAGSLDRYNTQSQGILDTVAGYKPYEAYKGAMVAGLTPDQIKARETANSSVGNWQGILGDAETSTKAAMGYDGTNVDAWLNPYISEVVDANGAYMDEQLAKQRTDNQARQTVNGSYGGSRHGVADAELARTSVMDRAKMQADLKSQGFTQAQQAGFQNQQAQYQGAGILGGMATAKQQLSQSDVSMLEQLGANEQQINQMKLDAERAEWDKEAADRLQKTILELQARSGILSSNPFGTSTTSSGSSSGTTSGTTMGASLAFGPTGLAIGG